MREQKSGRMAGSRTVEKTHLAHAKIVTTDFSSVFGISSATKTYYWFLTYIAFRNIVI